MTAAEETKWGMRETARMKGEARAARLAKVTRWAEEGLRVCDMAARLGTTDKGVASLLRAAGVRPKAHGKALALGPP